MTSQLLLDKADPELTLENGQDKENESIDDIKSYHDCLVGSYMSYLKAAGYSRIPFAHLSEEVVNYPRRPFSQAHPNYHQMHLGQERRAKKLGSV